METAIKKPPEIHRLIHPHYATNQANWLKWRYTYLGGVKFIDQFLKKFSTREDDNDFALRKALTYCPAYAKASINEIKNRIFSNLRKVQRVGGSKTYRDAVAGKEDGVDKLGNSMTSFLGKYIIAELLTMSRVGIYVDMPVLQGPTLADKGDKHPYLYWYRAEDIRAWSFDDDHNPQEFNSLLLRDAIFDVNEQTGLPFDFITRFRHYWVDDDGVWVQFYDAASSPIDQWGNPANDLAYRLDIDRIPFVMLEISDSLLADAADYQIALLNLASSDMSYCIKMNYPFYTEQFDPRVDTPYLRYNDSVIKSETNDDTNIVRQEPQKDVRVGIAQGRRYPINTERPQFINPSSEPLKVSMEKQAQLKQEIREIIGITLSSLEPPKNNEKEIKETGEDAGLAYIGLSLELAEKKITKYWEKYEGTNSPADIIYPNRYTDNSTNSLDLLEKVVEQTPSDTARREITKEKVRLVIGDRLPDVVMQKIYDEIDEAPIVIPHPELIKEDVEIGLVDKETASLARGYPKGSVEKAKQEHADRLELIAKSQTPGMGAGAAARGVPDLDGDLRSGKKEKKDVIQNRDLNPDNKDPIRGPGDKPEDTMSSAK